LIRLIKSIFARCINPACSIKYTSSGAALPIVLAMLGLGALVITPFLNHAGTNLKSSAGYTALMQANNSCEAGIEEAIWALSYNHLTDQISQVGDSVTFSLDQPVNQTYPSVSVTLLNSEGGDTQGTPGLIQDNTVATYKFAQFAYTPQIIPISTDVFAIVCRDSSTAGQLYTLTILPDGTFGAQNIDSLKFYSKNCYEPDILVVSDNIYAIAFRGSNDDGFISTVSINSAGQIGNSVIDTLEFDTSSGYEPHLIKVGDSVFTVAYRGSGEDGFLKTININSSGQIANSVIDTLEFDTTNGHEPDIEAISGEYYVIAYRGASGDGFLKTVQISAQGQIANSAIDSLEFDTQDCYEPDVLATGNNCFVVAYRGQSSDGFIKTVRIENSGMIANSITDSLEFDSSNGYRPNILHISGEAYAVVYRGSGSDGYVSTLAIDANGLISNSLIDTLTFDNTNGFEPSIIHVDGNIYAIAYRSAHQRGYVRSIDISTGGTGEDPSGHSGTINTYEILCAAGGSSITATISMVDNVVSVLAWDIGR
jgi:hypothetical protein